jgi:predicted DNA-binding WGR domain protein
VSAPAFLELLRAGVARGGFGPDDALAALLPLLRQVAATHEQGLVAPLRGLDALTVDGGRLGFDPAHAVAPRTNPARLAGLQAPAGGGVDVVAESRRTADLDGGSLAVAHLDIGAPDAAPDRPVFLPGYVAWEHAIEHHDALTDIFSLGLLLASLACGVDLTDADDLELFVRHRENLFALNPRLHPVLAAIVVQATELNRHRRSQELGALIARLESYRDQPTDLDLARLPGFAESGRAGKRRLIQAHLRDRLFDISRRNRLVYFRSTLGSLNLTLASVPLLLDHRNIRLDQLFTWHPALATQLSGGGPIALGRYVRFEDAPYAPGVLDRIIAEARRDRAEFGFAQLRLILVFLRWHNLKDDAAERIHSPLLLLPVELTKRRGIRDNYVLTPVGSEAEVNPALRHHLKQLYDLDLPEAIDLQATSLDAFHEELAARIRRSEPAVELRKIDRPRIEIIYERARQRLDQYRRRTPVRAAAPPGAPLPHSYARETFRPLGVQLFLERVKPSPAPLREVAGAAPVPRLPTMVAEDGAPGAGAVHEQERATFAVREPEATAGNPYAWDFDLCAITLGNLNYRKMTLVRDYTNLLETEPASEAFDRIFSLDPRPPEAGPAAAPPLADQHLVLPCDATQALALARARTGQSHIIQGPPGTGKSQTITNLIADYVARGKRVLFVCEKRAAIDVVFHRLRQQGLDALCCLIHDSQTDKKEFIQDLRRTYETWLAGGDEDDTAETARAASLAQMAQDLAVLGRFAEAMRTAPAEAGLPLRQLLHRLVELRPGLVGAAPMPATDEEALPEYAVWRAHGDVVHRLATTLRDLGEDACLARHPLRWLDPAVARADSPLATLETRLARAEALVDALQEGVEASTLPAERWGRVDELRALIVFADAARGLARRQLLSLLDAESPAARALAQLAPELAGCEQAAARAREQAQGWRTPLPADETQAALIQARRYARSALAVLRPGWWRLRRVLAERYDFARHAVRPGWVSVLDTLAAVHDAEAAVEAVRRRAAERLGTDDVAAVQADVTRLRTLVTEGPAPVAWLARHLVAAPAVTPLVEALAALRPTTEALGRELAGVLVDVEAQTLDGLGEAIRDLREAADAWPEVLPVLGDLAEAPAALGQAVRRCALSPDGLEAALGRRTVNRRYRADRPLGRFDGRALAQRVERLAREHRAWLDHNAACIRASVRRRFLEHVNVSAMPAAQLTSEQKLFKRHYAAGRRDLEHEFGKTMRYKSIRELSAGHTGQVIRDLKPVWLMSPLSLSDTLPLEPDLFDVVVFDEASQIPLEEAGPALFRAQQVIVVGDDKQLPPTQFFAAGRGDDEDALVVEDEGERIEISLDADSLLTLCAATLPSTLLAWHYRSRSEALISFSNAAFYGAELATIPDRHLVPAELPELRAQAAGDAVAHVDPLLARSISYHLMDHGVYAHRRNPAEAAYVAELVRELLRRGTRLTVGVVAFSEAQQSEIEDALGRLADADPDFATRLEAEYVREEDDQFCGLFVKNLENVQGDERDVIVMSVCYGYDASRRMLMNFGPINQRGGEKRLNVIFSRARQHMAIVSSIRHRDITNEYNDGANALRNFLQYAETVSRGDMKTATRLLAALHPLDRGSRPGEGAADAVVEQLAAALRARGHGVDTRVGQSKFRCDLAVRVGQEPHYRLGVLVDTWSRYDSDDLERYVTQPMILRAFGWPIVHVLTKDWLEEPEQVVARLERALAGGAAAEGEGLPADEEPPEPAPVAPPIATAPPVATPVAAEPAPAPVAGAARRFEFVGGASRKFWEITVTGATLTVRFGRLGTVGQTQTKSFGSAVRCEQEAAKLVAEKLRKGYAER